MSALTVVPEGRNLLNLPALGAPVSLGPGVSGMGQFFAMGAVAQLGERGLCKPEVVGSNPISSTMGTRLVAFAAPASEAGERVL